MRILALATCLTLIQPLCVQSQPSCLRLGDPPIEGQFTLYGAAPGGALSGLPVATGDYDGDGFLDLAAAPMRANVKGIGPDRPDAGLAYVFFGDGEISGFVDFATLPANSLVIYGARTGDHTGDEVWTGDVNGDGTDDILLCAQDADGPGGNTRNRAGSLYVILGNPSLRGATIDLLAPPQGVTTIHGAETLDRLGIWIRAGNLNGDAFEDILIGADGADGPSNTRLNSGCAYILYGRQIWPAVIDLVAPAPGTTVLFEGIDPQDRFGGTTGTGDFNGDGRIDVTLSAGFNRSVAALAGGPSGGGGDGPNNDRPECGEAYLFFHPEEGWPEVIDAASPPASVSMTVVYGEVPNDFLGEELAGGDLNKDGIDEWLVGAFPSRGLAGSGFVFEGGKHLENRSIDLLTLPTDFHISKILGAASPDIATDTMLVADVDSDSFNDLLVGSPMASFGSQTDVGRLDILFGRAEFFPPLINLGAPPPGLRLVCVHAPEAGDILSYSLDVGDWDRDGYADPMPNGMNGDGFENAYSTTGDAYVISGKLLASLAPTFTPTPSPTHTPVGEPTPTPTPTRSADLNGDGVVDASDLLILKQEVDH